MKTTRIGMIVVGLVKLMRVLSAAQIERFNQWFGGGRQRTSPMGVKTMVSEIEEATKPVRADRRPAEGS
jgi:hypothetical protein